jgi:putative nucleotidyltransferase with HDIG domain
MCRPRRLPTLAGVALLLAATAFRAQAADLGVFAHHGDVGSVKHAGSVVFENVEITTGSRSAAGEPVLESTLETIAIASKDRRVVHDWFPHPSPDGKWIVLLSYEKGVEGHPPNKDVMLRMMPVERGEIEVLARLLGGQGTINVPSWSPDSTQVAFVSYCLTRPSPLPDEAVETRERAVTLLRHRVPDPAKLRHSFAVEATMKALARETGGDPAQWALAGLLHDIDLAETAAAGHPSKHGIVGARLVAELGYSEAVVHAIEAHDDAAGVERAQPIAHALYCADRAYWAIHSSGLRFPSPEAATATPASVVEDLERRGITDRIDAELRRECALIGLTLDDVLRLSLEAMRALSGPEP